MTNRILLITLFVLSLLIAGSGCGGGGGTTGGSSGGTTGGTFGTIRVEAVNSAGQFVDPSNIQVGQTVHFQLVRYSTTGSRQVVTATGSWSTSDSANQAGVLQPDGTYTATAVSSATYTISASSSVDGALYQSTYKVLTQGASVRGKLTDSSGNAIAGVTIVFFDSGGNQVGSTTTSGNGTIYGAIPTTATRFNILSSSVNTTLYFQYYSYNGRTYDPLITTCSAPLPSLSSGSTSSLLGNLVLSSKTGAGGSTQPPPPPPTGCSGP